MRGGIRNALVQSRLLRPGTGRGPNTAGPRDVPARSGWKRQGRVVEFAMPSCNPGCCDRGTGRGPCLGGADASPLGEMNEFRHRVHLHFFHHPPPVDLDGFFHGAEIGGGLLVQLAGDDMG